MLTFFILFISFALLFIGFRIATKSNASLFNRIIGIIIAVAGVCILIGNMKNLFIS